MNSQQQQQQQGQGQQQPPPPSSQGPPSQADSPFDLSSFIAFPTANSIGHLPAGNDDLYRSFAQGIKSTSNSNGQSGSGQNASGGGMDGGYSGGGGYQQGGAQQQQQQQQQQASGSSGRPQSSRNKAAGGNGTNGAQGNNQGGNLSSPYGLDPSAFHGEVRFQVSVVLGLHQAHTLTRAPQ